MTINADQPTTAGLPRFLTVTEAAQRLGVSEMTMYRLINDGQFPAIRLRTRIIIPAIAVGARTNIDHPAEEPYGPQMFGIGATAAMLRVSSTTLRRLISARKFPAVRLRNRVLVPGTALDELTTYAIDSAMAVDPPDDLCRRFSMNEDTSLVN